jgi:hypothetical protein
MNIFKTSLDNSKCLKRKDHWIGTIACAIVFGSIYLLAKKNNITNTQNESHVAGDES